MDICVFMNQINSEGVKTAMDMKNPIETFNALVLDVGEMLCTYIVNRYCMYSNYEPINDQKPIIRHWSLCLSVCV